MKIKAQNLQAVEGKDGASFDYSQKKNSADEGSIFKEFDEETNKLHRQLTTKTEKKSSVEITSNMV